MSKFTLAFNLILDEDEDDDDDEDFDERSRRDVEGNGWNIHGT